ncbi:Ndr family [Nesidiocoris tenuis]|uniref:Ndr family n=1 Tax=Nesidiocoris tenuis TaxID=355587 RepID=A0ABN7BES7_9HEMI|nr:Ndr family [Nesidiocoris tenuis]
MPGGLGTSYRSLAGDVYKTTTTPAPANGSSDKFNVIETMKKAFSFSTNAPSPTSVAEPLIADRGQPVIVPRKMPTSATAEQTALLG